MSPDRAPPQRSTFRSIRIGVLLVLFLCVGAWGLRTTHRRAVRNEWRKPLRVAVVLLVRDPVPKNVHAAWAAGLPRFTRWFSDEIARYRGTDAPDPPVDVRLYGPVTLTELPPITAPDNDDYIARAQHSIALWRAFSKIDKQAEVLANDAGVYVLVEASGAKPTVEGLGAVGGDFGFVRADVRDDVSFALTAAAHELLHCLGATDKYDSDGHAVVPDGIVDPKIGYPQQFSEIMVGEIPLAPGKGRTAENLDQARVGEATAREIGWLKSP